MIAQDMSAAELEASFDASIKSIGEGIDRLHREKAKLCEHLRRAPSLPTTFDQYERFAGDYRDWRLTRDELLLEIQ